MKKVMIMCGSYIPAKKSGGPLTSTLNAVNALYKEYEFYIVAYDHDFGEEQRFPDIKDGWNTVGNASVYYARKSELEFNRKAFERVVTEVMPSVVWVSGVFWPAYILPLKKVCNKHGIKLIISPRGEVCEGALNTKKYKKIPYIYLTRIMGVYNGDTLFHSTSEEETRCIHKYLNVPFDRICYAENIASRNRINRKNYLKEKGEIKIVFISRIQEKKNLLFAIEVVNKMKCNVSFDIYGPIESKDYWEKCLEEINKSPDNIRINYRKELSPNAVSDTFSQYHCFLFPTKSENYGHVIPEALLAGCPVVLSAETTPWDSIDGKAGYIANLYDHLGFVNALTRLAYLDEEGFRELSISCQEFADKAINDSNAVEGHRKLFEYNT